MKVLLRQLGWNTLAAAPLAPTFGGKLSAIKRGTNADVLLTGATGLVGGAVLARLLERDPTVTVHCLIRANDAPTLEQRRLDVLRRTGSEHHGARVYAVAGDVCAPGLGLADPARLAARIHTIVHTAASTRFNLPLDEARDANVRPVEELVDFAMQCEREGGFGHIHHVSTAFVAGSGSGVLSEPPLDPVGPFHNSYEQTKWEAEQVLRAAAVPMVISRPSIIVGDSRTGATPHFRVIYEPMKWVYFKSRTEGSEHAAGGSSGMTDVLPCRPNVRLDVVPVDFVADGIVEMLFKRETIGGVFHLGAGPKHAITIDEAIDLVLETGNAILARRNQPPVPRPTIITPEMVEAEPALKELFDLGEQVMSLYLPYALEEQLFDSSATAAVLNHDDFMPPEPRDYFPTLIEYAAAHNFGRPVR
jgi:thioester reductase-like protein